MRKREQLSLEAGDTLIVTEQEEEDCGEDPSEEARLVGIEMRGMRGMTLQEPRASLEVKYMILDLIQLAEEEKLNILQLLSIKVQEERGRIQGGGKMNRVILKVEDDMDGNESTSEGARGALSFIKKSEASTPAKDRTKAREQLSRLEKVRERARKEVKLLLAGGREEELVTKLEASTDQVSRMEEAVKQLIHNEAMGKEVIERTASDIQKTKTGREVIFKLWSEAKERHTQNEDSQELKEVEKIRRQEKEDLTEKVRNTTDMLKEEEIRVEDHRKKIGETKELIERLNEEKRDIEQKLEARLKEN